MTVSTLLSVDPRLALMARPITIQSGLEIETAIILALFLACNTSWWDLLRKYGNENYLEPYCLEMSKKGLLYRAKNHWTLSNKGWEMADSLLPIIKTII